MIIIYDLELLLFYNVLDMKILMGVGLGNRCHRRRILGLYFCRYVLLVMGKINACMGHDLSQAQ
jgi:hypothetical protein